MTLGELKDAWHSVIWLKQKASAVGVRPDPWPQMGELAPKQDWDENSGPTDGIKGNTNKSVCCRCQHLNATAGRSSVSITVDILLK